MADSLSACVDELLASQDCAAQPALSKKRKARCLGAANAQLPSKRMQQDPVIHQVSLPATDRAAACKPGLKQTLVAEPGVAECPKAVVSGKENRPPSPACIVLAQGQETSIDTDASKDAPTGPSSMAAVPAATADVEAPCCKLMRSTGELPQQQPNPAPTASPPRCSTNSETDVQMDSPEELSEEEEMVQASIAEYYRVDLTFPAPHQGWRVGNYLLGENPIGDGGLGNVHCAYHIGSDSHVALKLCNKEFDKTLGSSDFTWWSFDTEWNTYCALNLGRSFDWMPCAYEAGLYRTVHGVVPWLSMELLGPSLHALKEHVPSNFAAYAHGMLSTVEGLHKQGFMHRDIKPANFGTQYAFDGKNGAPKVYLLDFGFAHKWNPEAAGSTLDFCGTPDFASIRSLQSSMPGPADDLEAVAYSMLQLWNQQMPWDITKEPQKQEAKLAAQNTDLILEGRTRHGGLPAEKAMSPAEEPVHETSLHTSSGWSSQQLKAMAVRKERLWTSMVNKGEVPSFLVEWVEYCQRLSAAALPDYDYLHALIDRGCAAGAQPTMQPAAKRQPAGPVLHFMAEQ